ncbi:SRPBCC domain-containing protein [Kribbella sp. CA-253562]|uniref:SRPBCC domain-containing protein n=1 Tax=Kribbella sp. CA-253562 TaxID=3239942 RepID=UPI003D90C7F6
MAKLDISTPDDTTILVRTELAAPRAAVWRAWTTPDLIRRWWSGGFGEHTVAVVDLRPGGAWRYVLRMADGGEVGFHGEYAEVVPEQRLVWSEVYEGAPPEESTVVTAEFADTDQGTALRVLIRSQDTANRDAVLASGFEAGLEAGYAVLEQLAREL